jgi:hypothetical protein
MLRTPPAYRRHLVRMDGRGDTAPTFPMRRNVSFGHSRGHWAADPTLIQAFSATRAPPEGSASFGTLALGIRQLRIVAPEAGSQPMSSNEVVSELVLVVFQHHADQLTARSHTRLLK